MADMITQGTTMNRLIHQAIRRDLARFTEALQRFTPGDHARATALAEAFGHFDTMLTHHHEGEERNLWPVIGDPDAGHLDEVAGLTTEHESIAVRLAASRDGERLVEGRLVHVFVDPATLAKQEIPAFARERLAPYVTGEGG